MRSSALSSFAILATSLLAKEVLASGRYDIRKRAVVFEEVLVTEEITVIEEADGSFVTGTPVIVGTTTIESTPIVVSSTVASTSNTVTPAVAAASTPPVKAAAPNPPAVVDQKSTTSTTVAAPVPTTSSTTPAVVLVATTSSTTPAVVLVATKSSTPVVVPTTFATSTSSSAPVSTGTTSGDQRGLAYNDVSLLEGFLASGSQVDWCYNWGSTPGGTVPSGLEYVAMLWGMDPSATTPWAADASSAIESGSSHLLSFNEPDLNTQSNLGFQEAANGYFQYMQPFAGKAKLGSPAVTNGDPTTGMGLAWLGNFTNACQDLGCTIDFAVIHWYDSATNIQYFQDHVTQAYAAGGNRPLWITEIGASGTVAEQQTFLETIIPWLQAQDFVERWAYFMVADGSLIDSGTTLSALGSTYAFTPS